MTTIITESVYPLKKPLTIEIRPQAGGRTAVNIGDHTYNFWNEDLYLHCDGVNLGLIIATERGEESWLKKKLKSVLKKGRDVEQYAEQELRGF